MYVFCFRRFQTTYRAIDTVGTTNPNKKRLTAVRVARIELANVARIYRDNE